MSKTFDKIYLASLPRAIVPPQKKKRLLDLCTSSKVFFHIYKYIYTSLQAQK